MNMSIGTISTVDSYMKTRATKNVALDAAQNTVERKTDDFDNLLKSTSTNGCSCSCSDGYESTFDVSI